jgi:CPA2 family monovalent cation:H+ antiporter-2
MMTVLAGVGGTGEISVAEVGQLGFRLILFTVVSLALGIRLLPKFIDLVAGMRSKEVLIVLTTGSAFAMAIFADALGLSIAAGAFIVGAITAEARSAGQIHRLSEPVRDIFGALFFVAMGMLVDLQVLREYVIPVVLIVFVVILGKMSACYLGVFISGYRKRTALQVERGCPRWASSPWLSPRLALIPGPLERLCSPLWRL